ncbi:MAG: tRNA 2-thiouridine(34) synthase MnmA [Burkholderiales bacterium]|nr:MAG: tRNA 2-thiouridine(34) synthase MnmA [Burkholderiales bacterium]
MSDSASPSGALAVPPPARDGAGERVVVGMSGGVDSSVAAWLLKERGFEVIGLFMKNWEDDDDGEYCSTRQDLIDAASAADVIGIEIEAVNFAAEYRDRVFAEFLREYSAGRTPNPDVLCNAEIKFKAFLDHAVALGAVRIATGHYAQLRRAGDSGGDSAGDSGGERIELLRGVDPDKDQSYFLHRLTQAQLARTTFPVGHLHKREVREIARRIRLPNAAKKDSTGICFIGERPFREFLNRYLPTRPGPVETGDGAVIGEHVGLAFYTLGQRKGIGIGGTRGGSGEPWFVARKDLARNALIVVQGHDHPWLFARSLRADQAHWIAGEPPRDDGRLGAKTRYRQRDARCALRVLPESQFELDFDDPQWAVTPGQSAVLYRDEVCLGGGIIASAD